jgi:glyoxylase-like metal-dependent hydrolase (beta-lactamase superfamily II)
MIENRKWQQAPGMERTLLYPIINKTNLNTSNSFIFNTPGMIVVIDPGNFGDQIEAIRQALAGSQNAFPKPIIACLTHCHVDHCFEFITNPAAIADGAQIYAAIQEIGFHSFRYKNRDITVAGLYKKTMPDPNLDICLLSAEDRRFNVSKKLILEGGVELTVASAAMTTSMGHTLYKQEITINGDMIRAYHTPGHSPDSVSYIMGDILFVGDVMFASDYFSARFPGWDRDAAMQSAESLLWLIEKEGIPIVAQGHGDVMTAGKAAEKFRKMIERLPGLRISRGLDLQTLIASSQHAVDVSKEANDIMAMMAESLNHIVHYLDILEESSEASNYAASLDLEKLGELFSMFDQMVDEMSSGKLIEMSMMLKSAVLFNKIRALLHSEGLECVVGQRSLSRLERLFDDYIEDSSGREIKRDMLRYKVRSLLKELVGMLKEDVHADESIFDTLDDEKAFVKSLIRRMAYRDVYKGVSLLIEDAEALIIRSDLGRLQEVIEIIIEAMVQDGSRAISFFVSEGKDTIDISVDGGLIPEIFLTDCYQKRALFRRAGWIDAVLTLKADDNSARVVLALPKG